MYLIILKTYKRENPVYKFTVYCLYLDHLVDYSQDHEVGVLYVDFSWIDRDWIEVIERNILTEKIKNQRIEILIIQFRGAKWGMDIHL